MARYSPTVRRTTTVPTIFDALNTLIDEGAGAVERRKAGQLEEQERSSREADRALNRSVTEAGLYERGFRRGAPPQVAVPEEEDIFRGALPGVRETPRVPDIFQGVGAGQQPGADLMGALDQIAERGAPAREPKEEILALPGSFVRGMGFTERAITSRDFVDATRERFAEPRMRDAPGTRRVSEDLYLDEEATPEARRGRQEEAARARETQRLTEVLAAIEQGGADPRIQAEALGLGLPASQVLRREDAGEITVSGRKFPDTEAGARAALAWRESLSRAARTGGGTGGAGGDGARITGEVTRRTLASAAARAIDQVRQEIRELDQYARNALPADYVQQQVQETLRLFGFESVEELQDEMRTLRLSGVDGPGLGGGASDEAIRQLIQENPDMTDEELVDLLDGGGE